MEARERYGAGSEGRTRRLSLSIHDFLHVRGQRVQGLLTVTSDRHLETLLLQLTATADEQKSAVSGAESLTSTGTSAAHLITFWLITLSSTTKTRIGPVTADDETCWTD